MKDFVVRIPSGTAADFVYLPVYETMTVIGAKAVNDAIPGADATISLISGSTTIGSIVVDDEAAAGTVTSATMSSTLATRKTSIGAATPLKVSCDGGQTTATGFDIVIRCDEFALSRD